ncbi:MAG: ABC transporter permease [Candidatus Aminicenantes bacterium]|nr:ABC transporter permease [Candidatus Aminicenantes bacterium]
MLKKEVNEILKQSLYFVIFVVCLPWLLWIGMRVFGTPVSYWQVLFPVFQGGLMIFGLISGVALFTAERKQNGMEYLMTLPISRFKLLAIKILPRLAALIVLAAVYWLTTKIFDAALENTRILFVLPTGLLFFMVFALFFTAVSLSAVHPGFLISSLLSTVVFCIYITAIYLLLRVEIIDLVTGYPEFSPATFVAVCLLALPLPLLFSFIFSFKKFDASPGKSYNRSFLKFFIPSLIIGLVLSSIYFYSARKPDYKEYYLTAEHKLLKETYTSTCIYDQVGVHKLRDVIFPVMILEYGDYLYFDFISYNGKVLRVDKTNYAADSIYTTPVKVRTRYITWRFGDTMALIDQHIRSDERALVLINLDTKAAHEIKLVETEPNMFYNATLIGADETAGQRYWLIYSGKGRYRHVMRVWEDGRSERLTASKTIAAYLNHLLITDDREGMIFSKITDAGLEIVKKLPEGKDISLRLFRRQNLDNVPLKELYGTLKISGRVLRIDLETFETNWLDIGSSNMWYFYPDHYYCLDIELDKQSNRFYLKTISLLENGKITLLKDFSGVKAYWELSISRGGFVIEEGGKVKVYTLPDCQELTFKDLN